MALAPEPGYAPRALVTDAAAIGLVETTLSRTAGTIVARHRPERSGTRATLFLHGAAGSWTTWTPLLATADAAGAPFTEPVVFDLPGWGDATPAADSPDITMTTICELVRDSALGLGYEEWDIVGHSMGGFIALHMAATWPESVRSVRLVSATGASVVAAIEHPWRGLRTVPGFVGLAAALSVLGGVDRFGRALVAGLARARLLRWFVSPLFRHTRSIHPTVIAALATELRPRSFRMATDVARGYDARPSWARITCTVRATMGDHDVFGDAADLDLLRSTVPAAVTSVTADCGHFGHIERPAAVLAAWGPHPA